jgi:hypothetical protein
MSLSLSLCFPGGVFALHSVSRSRDLLVVATFVALSIPRLRLVVTLRARLWRLWGLAPLAARLVFFLFLVHSATSCGLDGLEESETDARRPRLSLSGIRRANAKMAGTGW